LPRALRETGNGASVREREQALSGTIAAIVCASVLTIATGVWIMNRGGTITMQWIVETVLAADAALLLGRVALLALAAKRPEARATS
ncbi:undecaprenyl-phosphate glucose phosphotransferase, partial [Burkholderia multivorans]